MRALGLRPQRLQLVGGGARNPAWRRLLATQLRAGLATPVRLALPASTAAANAAARNALGPLSRAAETAKPLSTRRVKWLTTLLPTLPGSCFRWTRVRGPSRRAVSATTASTSAADQGPRTTSTTQQRPSCSAILTPTVYSGSAPVYRST